MRLEIMGFKVISLTSDGSSPDRKVYRLMRDPSDATTPGYRCPNPFTNKDRRLYLLQMFPISWRQPIIVGRIHMAIAEHVHYG